MSRSNLRIIDRFLRFVVPALLVQFTTLLSSARAADNWTLTHTDFTTESVALTKISDSGIVVGTGDAERSLSWDDVLTLDRPSRRRGEPGKFIAYLSGGERIGGEPTGFAADAVLWKNSVAGNLKLPLARITAIVRSGAGIEGLDENRKEDVVKLANGDTARGIVTAISDSAVSVQGNGDPVPVPLDSVASVYFATAPAHAASAKRSFRVWLNEGSSISVTSIALDGDHLTLTTEDKAVHPVDLASIDSIEQLDGPVSWLATHSPSENVQTPSWGEDRPWPARMGTTVDGKPIQIGERVYSHGIGVHSYSRLVFPLDGRYAAFRTGFSIVGDFPIADVTVRIKLDDKVVQEQTHVRAGMNFPPALIDLSGRKTLTLEMDYGDNADYQDRAAWLDPALLKTMPIPSTKPTTEAAMPQP